MLSFGFEKRLVSCRLSTSNLSYICANGSQLATERLETLLVSSTNIPFKRDPDFVDCGCGTMDQIGQRCAVQGSRIALVGLGGIG